MIARIPNVTARYACNGQEALSEIRSQKPHLVFLDINMPVMDGFEVLSELRRTRALERLHVVLVSTEGTDDDLERGLAAGAIDYVRKPFPLNAIADRIERLAAAHEEPPTAPPPAPGRKGIGG
jgi:two-component system chemotaxis response regulator CheY